MTTTIKLIGLESGASGVHPVPDNINVELGQGYNSFRDETRSARVAQPLTGLSSVQTKPRSSDRVRFRLLLIEDETSFRHALNIRASASYKGLSGRGSASHAVYNQVRISTESVYLLVSVSVINETAGMADVEMTPRAREAVAVAAELQGEMKKRTIFEAIDSDAYVSAITTGGALVAVLQYKAVTREEKRTVRTAVSGAVSGFKASGNRDELLETLAAHRSTTAAIERDGVHAPLPRVDDAVSLITYALEFAGLVDPDNAPVMTFATERFGDIPGSESLEKPETHWALEDLGSDRDRLQERMSDISFARNNLSLYPGVDPLKLQDDYALLELERIRVERWMERIAGAPFDSIDLAGIRPSLADLPLPPKWPSGASLPLVVTVIGNRTSRYDHDLSRVSGVEDEWVRLPCVRGILIVCNALDAGCKLKYVTRQSNYEHLPEVEGGKSTEIIRGIFVLASISVRVDGDRATELYDVTYEVEHTHRSTGATTSFPGHNGGWAGERAPSSDYDTTWVTGFKVGIRLRPNSTTGEPGRP